MRTYPRSLLALLLICGATAPSAAAAPLPAPASGHTYQVNSRLDQIDADPGDGVCASTHGGFCTLRAAVMESNLALGPNMISLPAGSYTLTRAGDDDGGLVGDLDLEHDVTLQGAGPGATIIDGNGTVTGDRVIDVLAPAQAVTLRDLTVRGGDRDPAAGDPLGGGGVLMENGGVLLLSDVVVEDNTAAHGGGLELAFGAHAQLNLIQSVVRRNHAPGTGGGLMLDTTNEASIDSSQIISNSAGYGGGLRSECALVNLRDVTLSENTASFDGGGLYAPCGAPGALTVANSTLAGNSAGGSGGGLYHVGDPAWLPLTVVNSTFSDNTSALLGAGLYLSHGTVQLANVTIAANGVFYGSTVPGALGSGGLGGGVYLTHTLTLSATNSIIAKNFRHSTQGHGFSNDDDCASLDSLGALDYDLFTTLANCTVGGPVHFTVISGVDPLLGPLANNGGDTPTRALLPGSPAIDQANPAGCADTGGQALNGDQRHALRNNGPCDMGAFEVVPETDLALSAHASPSPARRGAKLIYTIVVTNLGAETASTPDLEGAPLEHALVGVPTASQGSCTYNVSGLVCLPGALAAGAHFTATLVVTPTAAGPLTHTLSLFNSLFDPNLYNNGLELVTRVQWGLNLPLVRR
jgi:hypothetical protein